MGRDCASRARSNRGSRPATPAAQGPRQRDRLPHRRPLPLLAAGGPLQDDQPLPRPDQLARSRRDLAGRLQANLHGPRSIGGRRHRTPPRVHATPPPGQYGLEFCAGGLRVQSPQILPILRCFMAAKLVGPGQIRQPRPAFRMGRSTRIDDVLKVALRPHFAPALPSGTMA